jgi:hypothetical protein
LREGQVPVELPKQTPLQSLSTLLPLHIPHPSAGEKEAVNVPQLTVAPK